MIRSLFVPIDIVRSVTPAYDARIVIRDILLDVRSLAVADFVPLVPCDYPHQEVVLSGVLYVSLGYVHRSCYVYDATRTYGVGGSPYRQGETLLLNLIGR